MTFGEPSEALGARRNLGLAAMAAVATTARPSRHTECLICISFSVTAPEQGGSAPEKLGVASNQIERRNRAARLPQTGEANPTTPSRLPPTDGRSEEHTSELQSQSNLVCRLLLEKKKKGKRAS